MEQMEFINCKQELNTLKSEYEAEISSLVIIYGRRRVGKTRLIHEFIKDKDAFMFVATEESEKENRMSFKSVLADHLDHPLLREVQDLSWEAMFKELVRSIGDKKKIVVIDEFQYIGKNNKAFPSIFQKIWDTILASKNIMVILCGSAISMMKEQTLDYSSPLYGRRTAQIAVKQISFEHYKEFYPEEEQIDLIKKYALTGGVPKYIETLREFKTFEEKLNEIIQNKNSYLHEEPYYLLSKEVPDIGTYLSVLKTIALGKVKPSEISAQLELKMANLAHYFKVLRDMDMLVRETPVTEQNPGKSKKVIYRITDNFVAFWFKYVYPHRLYIETGQSKEIAALALDKIVEEHVSYVYEMIAREYVIRNWYKLTGHRYGKIGKWWDKHEEIDIAAIDEVENRILLGECKYKESTVGLKEYKDLVRKSSLVKWGKDGRKEEYVLFSKSGFSEALDELAKTDENLTLVKLK